VQIKSMNKLITLIYLAVVTLCCCISLDNEKIEYLISDLKDVNLDHNGFMSLTTYKTNINTLVKPCEVVNLVCMYTNQISEDEFPKSLLIFNKLESLWFAHTNLNSFPLEILEYNNLKSLNLSYNNISKIPKEVAKLKQLEELILSETKIEELPESLLELKNLRILEIESCYFSQTPRIIYELNNLDTLKINYSSSCKNNCFRLPNQKMDLLRETLKNTEILVDNN